MDTNSFTFTWRGEPPILECNSLSCQNASMASADQLCAPGTYQAQLLYAAFTKRNTKPGPEHTEVPQTGPCRARLHQEGWGQLPAPGPTELEAPGNTDEPHRPCRVSCQSSAGSWLHHNGLHFSVFPFLNQKYELRGEKKKRENNKKHSGGHSNRYCFSQT